MSFFIGEVVRWTPGDHYALVKPTLQFTKTGLTPISPRDAELDFQPRGLVRWSNPDSKCRLNRRLLFEKLPANLTGLNETAPKFEARPCAPQVVVKAPSGLVPGSSVTNLLSKIADQLNDTQAFLFCQPLKVYVQGDGDHLDYFGPFDVQDGKFRPSTTAQKVKRYRSTAAGVRQLWLQDINITILHPEDQLEKTDEAAIKEITVAGALEKLARIYPQAALKPQLRALKELLENPSGLSDEEVALLQARLAEEEDVQAQLRTLLPILEEHAEFAAYFRKELDKLKASLESQVRLEVEGSLREQLSELKERERALQREQEKVQRATQALATEQELIAASEHELLNAREALDQREADIQSLLTELPSQAKTMLEEVGIGLRMGYLLATPTANPANLAPGGTELSASDFRSLVSAHPPMARLVASWRSGRIPILAGSRALSLFASFGRIVCGSVTKTVSIDPLLTNVTDLFGRFERGAFIPHPSGLASLLLYAHRATAPSLVVFEGANRIPLELLLEPILQHREAGLPLFPTEAFRREDPWAKLGGLVWPADLLIGLTMTRGRASQRLPASLWDRLMYVDDQGWPRKDPPEGFNFITNKVWASFGLTKTTEEERERIEAFRETVPLSTNAGAGVTRCISLLQMFGIPSPIDEGLLLTSAAAAVCAGVPPEALVSEVGEAGLKRLQPLIDQES